MNRVVVAVLTLFVMAAASAAVAQQAQQLGASPSQPGQPWPQPGQSMPPSSQPGPSMPQPSQPGAGSIEVASDALIGSKVRNAQGQEIGEVSKIFVDPRQGTITRVLIKQGGTLGMGGKDVAVPWTALELQRDQHQNLVVTMQQPMLEQAPEPQQGSASPRTDKNQKR